MKFNFRNLVAILLISALIPIGAAYVNSLPDSMSLPDDPQNQHYISQIKVKEGIINKNKNDIEELILEIKSKRNEFSMAVNSIEDDNTTIKTNKNTINEEEKKARELLVKIDNLKSKIRDDMKNKNYNALLKDMSTLISTQRNSHNLLQKLNIDLDKSLNTLH